MQIQNRMATITELECAGALSDHVLAAARAAVAAHPGLIQLPAAGVRNQPLLPLLVALLDATQATANAIADNAWDDCFPLPCDLATDLVRQARAIASDIENATQCPNAAEWLS